AGDVVETTTAGAALTTRSGIAGVAVETTAASGTLPASGGPQWQSAQFNFSLTVGVPFSLNLDTLCSDPLPVTYTPIGPLPAGLTQSGTRNQTISGTPTTVQTVSMTEQADDGSAMAANATIAAAAAAALTTSGGGAGTAQADFNSRI